MPNPQGRRVPGWEPRGVTAGCGAWRVVARRFSLKGSRHSALWQRCFGVRAVTRAVWHASPIYAGAPERRPDRVVPRPELRPFLKRRRAAVRPVTVSAAPTVTGLGVAPCDGLATVVDGGHGGSAPPPTLAMARRGAPAGESSRALPCPAPASSQPGQPGALPRTRNGLAAVVRAPLHYSAMGSAFSSTLPIRLPADTAAMTLANCWCSAPPPQPCEGEISSNPKALND